MEFSWEILKRSIYDGEDMLLDIYVLNASQEDWIKWAEYVNDKYELSFYNHQTDTYENTISLSVFTDYWNNRGEDSAIAIVAEINLGTILIKRHFFDDTQIENDFDPGDINTIDDHHKIVSYMTDISKLLSKKVILTPENSTEYVLISVNSTEVKINAH